MTASERPLCNVCHIGRQRLHLVTYVQVYHQTLVSVPNTPAWECDFCHTVQYDEQAIQRINALVEQSGPPPNRPQRQPRPARSQKPPILPAES
jgi:YgiT-type zinc finger domain-containing protein